MTIVADEKASATQHTNANAETIEYAPANLETTHEQPQGHVDPVEALKHLPPDIDFTPEEEKRVLRRLDRHLLPIMLGAYFLQ